MAGPHVTGLIGLMWAANPGLRGMIAETHETLFHTTVPLTGQNGSNCGGDYELGPNNDWGYGTIDALAAVQAAMSFGGVGTLAGTVTDAVTSDPLAGVLIRASLNPTMTWQTVSDDFGQYSRLVFSGTYTVTSELYGYYPTIDTGIEVISGTTTTLDLQMPPAPFYTVSGRVSDVTTGWPIYAQIDIDGYPGDPFWNDPLTGEYTISLAAGIEYTFDVTNWVEGYKLESRTVGPLSGPHVEDFALTADALLCTAPGYLPQFTYFEDFEASDGGYTVEGDTSWEWGAPTSGPRSAHSGNNVWATNLSGDYSNGEYGSITSPDIDLSQALDGGGGGGSDQILVVTWWQWLETEECCDPAWVEVSNDGGLNWLWVSGSSGSVDTTWTKYTIYLDASYAVSNFRIRFTLQTDGSITAPGFYVDDIGIGTAEPPPTLYTEDFEANDGSYTVSGVASWQWGTPTRGPSAAHSGLNVWATNLSGNYRNNEDSYLTSPEIDLLAKVSASAALHAVGGGGGGGGTQQLMLSWWQWLQTESGYDFASVEVSDGVTWSEVYTASGIITTDWQRFSIFLDPQYAVPNFQVRFHLLSDSIVAYPGFYVDDVDIEIYTGEPAAVACDVQSGGLVIGNVYDANTSLSLNAATLASSAGNAISRATPEDAALEDGFYVLFASPGPQVITATLKDGYGMDVRTPSVLLNDVVLQDFPRRPAGSHPPHSVWKPALGWESALR